jgi:hypothetical protein
MTQISFDIKGARLVSKSLHDLRRELPRIARGRIFDALKRIVNRFKKYPPRRTGQRYVRTFKLKRGFRIKRKGKVGYTVANVAKFRGRSYPKYVIGDAAGDRQAWMHVGRWRVLREEMENELEKMPKAIASRVHFFVRSTGVWKAGAVA